MAYGNTVTSCSIAQLPPELLARIFLELAQEKQALVSCSFVSYSWRKIALPVLMRHVVITHDHLDDRSVLFCHWPFTHRDNWKHVQILELTRKNAPDYMPGQDYVHVDLDALKNVLPKFPALDELRLAHVAILSAPVLSLTALPHRIRSLTLRTKGFLVDDEEDFSDDGMMEVVQDIYDPASGLPMFSTLSAILSAVVPDLLTLMGGYVRNPCDPPDSVLAPTSVKIRRLSIGKRWFDLSYWCNLLEPNTLEHLTMPLAWGDRERAVVSLTGITPCLDSPCDPSSTSALDIVSLPISGRVGARDDCRSTRSWDWSSA